MLGAFHTWYVYTWYHYKSFRIKVIYFIGKPALLYDTANPDWVPSQNLGYTLGGTPDLKRYTRIERRKRKRLISEVYTFW